MHHHNQSKGSRPIKIHKETQWNDKRSTIHHFWMFQLNVSLNVSICNYETFNIRKNENVTRHNQNDCFFWLCQFAQFETLKFENSLIMKWNIIYGGFDMTFYKFSILPTPAPAQNWWPMQTGAWTTRQFIRVKS